MYWVWAILLLVLGVGLAILEVFIPSAGILCVLAAASVVGAVIMGFRQGPIMGFGILIAAVVGLPAMLVLALKYWPRTAMGRRVLLAPPKSEEVLPDDPNMRTLKTLVGRVGRAKSRMLPAGVILIDGRTIDAVSEGMPIDPGRAVRVIEVRGNRVVVRQVEEETPSQTAENPLERPIDSVVPDPFEEESPPA